MSFSELAHDEERLPLLKLRGQTNGRVCENADGFDHPSRGTADAIVDSLTCCGEELLCCVIPKNWIFLKEDGSLATVNNGAFTTFVLLLNSMIGSGILFQAHAVSKIGYILAIVLYALLGFITYLGIYLLVRSAEKTNIYWYSDLVKEALGKNGVALVELSIVTATLASFVIYVYVIGDLIEGVFSTYVSPIPWYLDQSFITVVTVVFLAIPFCLARRFAYLAAIAYFGQAVTLAVFFLVVIGGPIEREGSGDDDATHNLKMASLYGLDNIGTMIFATVYASSAFHVYLGMSKQGENPEKAFSKATKAASSVGSLILCSVGVIGYVSFGSNTEQNIINNFSGATGTVFRILVVMHILFFMPGEFVVMRTSFLNFLNIDAEKQDNSTYVLSTVLTLLLVTLTSVLLCKYAPEEGVDIVLNIFGGAASVIYAFILPGIVGARFVGEDPFCFYAGYMLAAVGTKLLIIVVIAACVS